MPQVLTAPTPSGGGDGVAGRVLDPQLPELPVTGRLVPVGAAPMGRAQVQPSKKTSAAFKPGRTRDTPGVVCHPPSSTEQRQSKTQERLLMDRTWQCRAI